MTNPFPVVQLTNNCPASEVARSIMQAPFEKDKGRRRILFLPALLLAVLVLAVTAPAIDCNNHSEVWSTTKPLVNERHIFCGEISSGGQPKGYHSTQIFPSDVVNGIEHAVKTSVPGVYNATVQFTNDEAKFSTFFPDACSMAQIVTSVQYAATHQTGPANGWGFYGPSAPSEGGSTYCLDTAGKRFNIKMGFITKGGEQAVNTAFPYL